MLDLALRATAAAFLLASAVQLATKHRQRPAGVPGALLCCGLIAYLAAPSALTGDRSSALAFIVLALATANPPLIWLLARAVFRERLGIGATQLAAAVNGTDELLPGGKVITDIGMDHRYADPRIEAKTAALTRVVLDLLADARI